MRRSVGVLLVAAACTPLTFVVMLFVAAKAPLLDGLTIKMPEGIRAAVGEIAMFGAEERTQSAKVVARVARIDPENPEILTRRCREVVRGDPGGDLASCQEAAARERSEVNLNQLGLAQERSGDFCAAEDSFTRANMLVNAHDAYVLRNLGRAAMKCGHTAAGVAAFEVAEEVDARAAEGDDDDSRRYLLADREWLVIANQANHDTKAAATMCTTAHPEWKRCDCTVSGTEVKCSERH